jgi:tetratricopeptide (TPR) repeat protein
MKRLYFIPILLLNCSFLFSQRDLTIEDRSNERDVFRGNEDEAGLVISCLEDIPLTFVFQHKTLEPTQTETLAGVINYKFKFSTRYKERTITIHSKNYNPINLTVALSPKQLKTYYIKDPDAAIINCYYELTKEGLALFKSGMYKDAKDKYEMAKNCDEVPIENDIDEKLAIIDSIFIWRNKADTYLEILDYSSAIEYYKKIYAINSEDKYISNKLLETQLNERERCTLAFTNAEGFFIEKDYENAKDLYKKVVSLGCYNSANAIVKLQEIAEIEKNKKQLSHVLTYEYADNTSIGISTGNYKEHKTSGYFTLRLNPDVFETMRSNPEDSKKPELNVSFGWTIKTIKPIWIFFGPGYTGVGEYVYDEEDINKADDPKIKIHNAISPEIGLLGKIKITKGFGVALRYTFQYRFALTKDMEDFIGKTKHVFGIGFCF